MRKSLLYSELTNQLEQIYCIDIVLEPGHLEKKECVLMFLNRFKEFCMRKNQVFADCFHGFYCTGSYFEDLRVRRADEFDVNLVFNLPVNESHLEIEELGELPYSTFRLNSDLRKKKLKNLFFDKDGYLSSQGLLSWLQTLLDWFRESLPSEGEPSGCQKLTKLDMLESSLPHFKEQLSYTNSGPARTIKILCKKTWISVDLVPVFMISSKNLRMHGLDSISKLSLERYNGYLVPKALRRPDILSSDKSGCACYAWRLHFPQAEVEFLAAHKNVRKLIKLAKALNEKQKLNLPSYFLKVIVLWIVKDNSSAIWRKCIGALFILFLEKFEECLVKQHLGHIFYPKFNLLHDFSSKRLKTLLKKVQRAKSLLLMDPLYAVVLFDILYVPFGLFQPTVLKKSFIFHTRSYWLSNTKSI